MHNENICTLKKINKNRIIGTWEGGADDVSGLRTMIYNYGVTFNKDGTGESFSWSVENNEDIHHEDHFVWEYLGDDEIRIRYIQKNNEEWLNFKIAISQYKGPYKSKYHKLVEKGTDKFRGFPEPLYKSRSSNDNSFFLNMVELITSLFAKFS